MRETAKPKTMPAVRRITKPTAAPAGTTRAESLGVLVSEYGRFLAALDRYASGEGAAAGEQPTDNARRHARNVAENAVAELAELARRSGTEATDDAE